MIYCMLSSFVYIKLTPDSLINPEIIVLEMLLSSQKINELFNKMYLKEQKMKKINKNCNIINKFYLKYRYFSLNRLLKGKKTFFKNI